MSGAGAGKVGQLRDETTRLCKSEFESCVRLLGRLIACPSLSGNEGECAEALTTYLESEGIPALRDRRGSILAISLPAGMGYADFPARPSDRKAWLRGLWSVCADRNMPILAYNAHMDVVPADDPEQWSGDPFAASRREGKIFGRGTCDMKGALAAMACSLVLMRELDEKFERKRLVVGCFCTEEEVAEGLAFKELCEEFELKPSMVLLGEPSQMEVARGQRGKLEFFVETQGRAAHTSVPEAGENAAYKLARALLAIEDMEEKERREHGLSAENILARNTVVATSIQSWPESQSFVPERARAYVTARMALGRTFDDIRRDLEASEDWPEATVAPIVYTGKSYMGKAGEWAADHPAWETPVESRFFKLLGGAYREVFGRESAGKIWPFSTDGVYSAGMAGIPTLGLGPGREKCAHIVDEWVGEEELREALTIYTHLGFFECDRNFRRTNQAQ